MPPDRRVDVPLIGGGHNRGFGGASRLASGRPEAMMMMTVRCECRSRTSTLIGPRVPRRR